MLTCVVTGTQESLFISKSDCGNIVTRQFRCDGISGVQYLWLWIYMNDMRDQMKLKLNIYDFFLYKMKFTSNLSYSILICMYVLCALQAFNMQFHTILPSSLPSTLPISNKPARQRIAYNKVLWFILSAFL